MADPDFRSIVAKPDNVPITIMVISVMLCLWIAFRRAALNDSRLSAGLPLVEEDKDDKVLVWPDLVYTELICLVLATAALIVWGIVAKAPLEQPANRAVTPNPSKAPWYFLGLQEMLVYFDPWLAGVVLPTLIVVGLMAIPYIDTNPRGNGYYSFRERKWEIGLFLYGFLVLWSFLIITGTFLRGPNWSFYGPYEYWDTNKLEPLVKLGAVLGLTSAILVLLVVLLVQLVLGLMTIVASTAHMDGSVMVMLDLPRGSGPTSAVARMRTTPRPFS